MKMLRTISIPAVLCAALLLPAAAADTEGHGSLAPNVALTITVRNGDDAQDRAYRLLLRGDTSPARLMTGWRVPVPTATEGDGDGATIYSYQNVGMTTSVRARLLPGDRVALEGQLEVSGSREVTEGTTSMAHAPIIGTFEQGFNVLLDEGRPVELAAVAGPKGGALSVRLEVEVLD
jgi:hypothetical protein